MQVEGLQCLHMTQLQRLSNSLEPQYFDDGVVIAKQGEPASVFFFITTGEGICTVKKNPSDPNESPKVRSASEEALRLSLMPWS